MEPTRLSREEQETVIIFNALDDEAVVNTANMSVFKKLQRLGYKLVSDTNGRAVFFVNKTAISFRKASGRAKPDVPKAARAKRILSPSHLAAMQAGRKKATG